MPPPRAMAVPVLSVFIVGAGKAASTRIFGWLDEHPAVCMAHPKEPQFFSCHYGTDPGAFWPPFFAHCRGEPHAGEATPGYLHLPYVPARIAAAWPRARIIMSLRHPIDRAYSDWWMHHARGDDRASFDEAMRICQSGSDRSSPDPEQSWIEHLGSTGSGRVRARPYLEIGHYDEHLSRYRAHFRDEQIKVVLFDDIQRDAGAAYADICAFLGLSPVPVSTTARNPALSRSLGRARRLRHSGLGNIVSSLVPQTVRTRVKGLLERHGGTQPPMAAATRQWLLDHYAPHNDRLGHMLGRDLVHWNR
jgi:hypothetical protein